MLLLRLLWLVVVVQCITDVSVLVGDTTGGCCYPIFLVSITSSTPPPIAAAAAAADLRWVGEGESVGPLSLLRKPVQTKMKVEYARVVVRIPFSHDRVG